MTVQEGQQSKWLKKNVLRWWWQKVDNEKVDCVKQSLVR